METGGRFTWEVEVTHEAMYHVDHLGLPPGREAHESEGPALAHLDGLIVQCSRCRGRFSCVILDETIACHVFWQVYSPLSPWVAVELSVGELGALTREQGSDFAPWDWYVEVL